MPHPRVSSRRVLGCTSTRILGSYSCRSALRHHARECALAAFLFPCSKPWYAKRAGDVHDSTEQQRVCCVSPQKSGAESPCSGGWPRRRKSGIMARTTRHLSPLEPAALCLKTLTCTAS